MAMANGTGCGPVTFQPPPLMYSLPPTASAWSARRRFTFIARPSFVAAGCKGTPKPVGSAFTVETPPDGAMCAEPLALTSGPALLSDYQPPRRTSAGAGVHESHQPEVIPGHPAWRG